MFKQLSEKPKEKKTPLTDEFPKDFEAQVKAICGELNLAMGRNTNFEAINCEVSWLKGNVRKRIDFEYDTAEKSLKVSLYLDTYPFNPELLIWAYDYVPLFPDLAKTSWKSLETLPVGKGPEFYGAKIRSYINQCRDIDIIPAGA